MRQQLSRLGLLGVGLALTWTTATCQTGHCPLQSVMVSAAQALGLVATTAPLVTSSSTAASASQTEDETSKPEKQFPLIEGHGGIFPLPNAPHQPRDGSKLCVDITAGGDVGKLSPPLEKLTRYLNIYAGAGSEPATVQMSVIMHGEATLKVLKPDAYASRFGTEGNPNLAMLQLLREHGVKLYVCGQSLMTLGAVPDEVADGVEVAVSALTCNVNLQQDGYQVVNMH